MIINRLPYARKEEEAKNKTVYSRMTSREYVFSIIVLSYHYYGFPNLFTY